MKIKSFLFSSLIIVIISCASQDKHNVDSYNMQGVFKQKNNNNLELRLNGRDFLFIDVSEPTHLPTIKCCDTITYGKYELNNDFLSLFSSENLDKKYLDLIVSESIVKNSDSIVFKIDNKIEKHYRRFKEKHRELYYSVTINTLNDLITKKTDRNPIVFKNIGEIHNIDITVNVKSDTPLRDFSLRKINTLSYNVLDSNSNLFEINIPELSYEFLAYKRLNNDYVKIVNNNVLLWDNEEYVRR